MQVVSAGKTTIGAHVDELVAKRLLDEATSLVDEETRASMLANVRVNREIVEACRAEGIA